MSSCPISNAAHSEHRTGRAGPGVRRHDHFVPELDTRRLQRRGQHEVPLATAQFVRGTVLPREPFGKFAF